MRKFLSMAIMFLAYFALSAQAPTPLPLDKNVKTGVLPNGLTYYILHNSEPKERANFYIAQKVGSTLETPEQLGLAHFLEHMAFNGTKHYPGHAMLDYLQAKGIRFGADINAYTSFDETVYNINNVPTSDKALMDSVLLVLHDWSGSILLEESEINAERGVIQEEWRTRRNAESRMYEAMLPAVYKEYQYQQMPIGKMEVVMNFKPEVLRAYYEKWYRPDQQGIVVVGDFDADEMEQKVIAMFSDIPMPENAAPRTYPEVSNNQEPIFFSYADPELKQNMVRIFFKRDRLPVEYRNTDFQMLYGDILPRMVCTMINDRLTEYAQTAECKYAYAGVAVAPFLVSTSKDSFMVLVIPKGNVKESYEDALAVVARACTTGFTPSEVERARDKMIANYEKALSEKDKTDSDDLAQEIIRHFIENVPAPGIELESTIAQQVLNTFPVEVYNEFAATLMTPDNEVITVAGPDAGNLIVESEAVTSLQNALSAQYEAFVDEVVSEPLIAELPKKGFVISTLENPALGTKTYTLSNGIKVVVKATDFAADEILMQAWENGGKRSFEKALAPDVLLCEDVYGTAQIGPFSQTMLKKYLAGKKAALSFGIGNYTNYFDGVARVKDLPTLMELIYASFTDLRPDKETFNVMVDQAKAIMANYEKDPNFVFRQRKEIARYGNNPFMNPLTISTIDKANYDDMFAIIKDITSNPADFTFNFVGNIDEATFVPLIEQYIATLPVSNVKQNVQDLTSLALVSGKVTDQFKQEAQVPSVTVFDCYNGDGVKFSQEHSVMMDFVGEILEMMYTKSLREEEGGTYGASTLGSLNPNNGQWQILYQFQTSQEKQKRLRKIALKELNTLLFKGANPEYFNRVKEAALKQLDINERTNQYWQSNLLSYQRGFDYVTNARGVIEGITLDKLNQFMKQYLKGSPNRIEVVMEAGPKK